MVLTKLADLPNTRNPWLIFPLALLLLRHYFWFGLFLLSGTDAPINDVVNWNAVLHSVVLLVFLVSILSKSKRLKSFYAYSNLAMVCTNFVIGGVVCVVWGKELIELFYLHPASAALFFFVIEGILAAVTVACYPKDKSKKG